MFNLIIYIHPEIIAALTELDQYYSAPNAITLYNTEKLLNYIEDINLEKPNRFIPTPAQSLYLLRSIDDWELPIECKKNGPILYTFCKSGLEKAWGNYSLNKFIPQLEKYLLSGLG